MAVYIEKFVHLLDSGLKPEEAFSMCYATNGLSDRDIARNAIVLLNSIQVKKLIKETKNKDLIALIKPKRKTKKES